MRGSCFRKEPLASVYDPGLEPASDEAAEPGERVEFIEQVSVIDAVETVLNVSIEDVLWRLIDAEIDCSDGIMGTTPGSKAIRVCLKLRFPLRFEDTFDQRLHGAISHRRDA